MILCLGTTPSAQRTMVFEKLRLGEVNRAARVHDFASGKPINVARVVQMLGHEAIVVGLAGGQRGRFLREELDRAGIGHDLVEVAPQTRLCTTLIDRSRGAVTELVEESAAVEADAWPRLDEKLARLRPRASVVVCSGSLTPGAPQDLYARQVTQRHTDQQVIVDGRGQAIGAAMREGGFILKLNREELAATFNVTVDDSPAWRQRLLSATPQAGYLVVTLGADGALLSDGAQLWRIAAPAVPVISAIGSGDAFAAGLAVGFAQRLSLLDACKLAAACGTANAMTEHAGHVYLEDVQRLRDTIAVRGI